MAKKTAYTIEIVPLKNPGADNIIFGQSHFIKTVEDIHESLVGSVPGIVFGAAFSEASGRCLIRTTGTDRKLQQLAAENLRMVGCGHTFLIILKQAFPINVVPVLKQVPEIVRIFCATANPVQVAVIRTKQGGGVLGVIDGMSPSGTETAADRKERMEFLRKLGYKLGV